MNKFSKFPADVICELHPLFKGLLWVSAARSEDETRFVLTTISVEREGSLCHIVATDGRRLHVHTFDPGLFDTDIEMIEPGLYEVIAKTSKLIVIAPSEIGSKYPNWRATIPDYEPEHSDSINAMTISKIGIITGILLATDFVQDAIGFGYGRKKDSNALIEYGSPVKSGAFVIRHDLGKAIVMPMRMFQDEEQDLAADPAPKTEKDATPDLPGFERSPIVDVEATVEPLGLPAPQNLLPAPELTEEEQGRIQNIREEGMAARAANSPANANPYSIHTHDRIAWFEGWDHQDGLPVSPADEPPAKPKRTRKPKAGPVVDVPAETPEEDPEGPTLADLEAIAFAEGRQACADGTGRNPYDQTTPGQFNSWTDGFAAASHESAKDAAPGGVEIADGDRFDDEE